MIIDGSTRGHGTGYWHAFGTATDDPEISAEQHTINAGMDYPIYKTPLTTTTPSGTSLEIANSFAIISERNQTTDIIAVVGNGFTPVQNIDIAKKLDQAGLTGPGGMYGIDVAGVTRDGRRAFWALQAKTPYQVAKDDYRDHWIITDGKDGGSALTIMLTPIRTVCSNALAMAAAGASVKVGISHRSDAENELDFWLKLAPQLEIASARARGILKQMATKRVNQELVNQVLQAAYPDAKPVGKARILRDMPTLEITGDAKQQFDRSVAEHELAHLRVIAHRTAVQSIFASYQENPEEKNIRGTLLGIVNAVADYENHRPAQSKREDAALSNMFGPRYQSQANAMKAAVALI